MSLFKTIAFAFIGFATILPAAYSANEGSSHAMPASSNSKEAAALSDGEIRKVDKSAGKLTIKHGPLVNLDMMPMTMVFRVKDPAMLDQVKAGDKIRFQAESINGALTVVKLEPAKP